LRIADCGFRIERKKRRSLKSSLRALFPFLILFPLLCGNPLAQDRDYKSLFPNIFEDQKELWTFPLKPQSWKQEKTWLFVLLTAPSFALDGEASRDLRTDSSFDDFNCAFASRPADIALGVLPFSLLAAGEISRHPGLTQFGWKSSEAAIDAFVVGTVLKTVTQRSRPHEEREFGFWEGGNSFPSGHALVAWSLAATTANHFKERRWVAWLVYPLAGALSFSRVTSGNHFMSDVVVGSALGYLIGRHVVD